LPEAGKPIVPNPWRDINTMTISFGHGLSISPMHLVTAVSAVVNGGILFPPTLLRQRDGDPTTGTRVLSAQHSDSMRKLLRLVVEQGTGAKAEAPGYLVGGKTGTAEKSKGRGYSQKALLSSFVAAFPMTAPRYTVYVMLDEPRATKETHGYATGGWVAAPVVSRVITQIAPLLGVAQVDQSAPEVRQRLALDPTGRGKQLASH
jgi:cell division protein FtsI (penicillin-binding protein 3)